MRTLLVVVLAVVCMTSATVAADETKVDTRVNVSDFIVSHDLDVLDKLIGMNMQEAVAAITHARLAPLRAKLDRLNADREQIEHAKAGLETYLHERRTQFVNLYDNARTPLEKQSLAAAYARDRGDAEARLEVALQDLATLHAQSTQVELALRLGSIPDNPVPGYDGRRVQAPASTTLDKPTITPEQARRIYEEAVRQVDFGVSEGR